MTVHFERRGAVAVLTIDRPEVRNALDHATLDSLAHHFATVDADPAVRAVVLTATGDRAFSAGLDLKALAEHGVPDPATSPVNLLRDGGYAKPVIAALNGAAIGGGFELALACDLRVAAEHVVFGLPEVARGLSATEGGTDLPRRLPLAVALEIGLTGLPLTAARGYELGLVNRVVPADQVLATAVHLAETIAGHSPSAIAATKALMISSLTSGLDEQRRDNRAVTVALLAGPDSAEGARAFLEKRPPVWAPPSH